MQTRSRKRQEHLARNMVKNVNHKTVASRMLDRKIALNKTVTSQLAANQRKTDKQTETPKKHLTSRCLKRRATKPCHNLHCSARQPAHTATDLAQIMVVARDLLVLAQHVQMVRADQLPTQTANTEAAAEAAKSKVCHTSLRWYDELPNRHFKSH
jgi:hypothetical protein